MGGGELCSFPSIHNLERHIRETRIHKNRVEELDEMKKKGEKIPEDVSEEEYNKILETMQKRNAKLLARVTGKEKGESTDSKDKIKAEDESQDQTKENASEESKEETQVNNPSNEESKEQRMEEEPKVEQNTVEAMEEVKEQPKEAENTQVKEAPEEPVIIPVPKVEVTILEPKVEETKKEESTKEIKSESITNVPDKTPPKETQVEAPIPEAVTPMDLEEPKLPPEPQHQQVHSTPISEESTANDKSAPKEVIISEPLISEPSITLISSSNEEQLVDPLMASLPSDPGSIIIAMPTALVSPEQPAPVIELVPMETVSGSHNPTEQVQDSNTIIVNTEQIQTL